MRINRYDFDAKPKPAPRNQVSTEGDLDDLVMARLAAEEGPKHEAGETAAFERREVIG
jgi:hypothetical protein